MSVEMIKAAVDGGVLFAFCALLLALGVYWLGRR
jgi:hypothetical protein